MGLHVTTLIHVPAKSFTGAHFLPLNQLSFSEERMLRWHVTLSSVINRYWQSYWSWGTERGVSLKTTWSAQRRKGDTAEQQLTTNWPSRCTNSYNIFNSIFVLEDLEGPYNAFINIYRRVWRFCPKTIVYTTNPQYWNKMHHKTSLCEMHSILSGLVNMILSLSDFVKQ